MVILAHYSRNNQLFHGELMNRIPVLLLALFLCIAGYLLLKSSNLTNDIKKPVKVAQLQSDLFSKIETDSENHC